MKLGIITDGVRNEMTGIGNYTKNLCIGIQKYKNVAINYIDYEENNFNKECLIKVHNPFPFFKTYLWYNYLPLQLNKVNFDYVLNTSGGPHIPPYKYKEIFFVYDLTWLVVREAHPCSRVLIYKVLFGKTIKSCYKIVVISQSTKLDLIKYYHVPENKITVIYPSFAKVNTRAHKPKIRIKKPYILYLGTLEPRKNIPFLIRAFKKVRDNLKIPHKLIIAGKKGWGFKEIFDTIHKFGLEKQVIFTGYVSDAEKKYLYKHAELFIYPSLYEGFGIPPLEAMHFGCPVITSNTSSLPEVVGNAGLMIDPYNVEALVSAITKVINDKKLRKEMVRKGFKRAEKFNSPSNLSLLFN